MGQGSMRNGFLYLILLAVLAVFLFTTLRQSRDTVDVVSISQVAADVQAGKVKQLSEKDGEVDVTYRDEATAAVTSRIEQDNFDLVKTLHSLGVTDEQMAGVVVEFKPTSRWENLAPVLFAFLPIVLIALFFFFILRQAQGAGNQAFSFGKSKARVFTGDKPTVTFDDVAGAEESKEELKEVVEFLKEPQKFAALGARIPKGVLLVGPPGTGKTLMAKAVSGEAGVPFFSISGSEFVEMFVGVGASRVRDLFEQAKRNSPCIIFIDEIDAVGRHRGAGLGGSHDEREQTLNQILVEMDGFDTDTNVIIVAATNRPDILDPALLRPGRFDRRVVMDRPDVRGREAILKVHVRGKPLGEDVDLEVLARATPGFVGADLENMVNEGAILAARRNRRNIAMTDLTEAIERVAIGPERRSRVISQEQKRVIAYHEAGHALVQEKLTHTTPVLKVTIIGRGMAGGYMWPLDKDSMLRSRSEMEEEISVALAGRAAEEIVFGKITTGASNDLEQVTQIARRMVTVLGMSERMGPLTYGHKEEMMFLGREINEQRNYSEEVAEAIDREVQRIVAEGYERTMNIINTYRDLLNTIAEQLMEVETLDQSSFKALFA
ncbi:MAG: ATP-dependent zinc metalloprotease FtsH [Anaerolineae bacterium]|nr:ATP-dependent zinc metalloprotease FtsH [Anaerolineae bacterium]MCB9132491.1 ATP-dependent zinc metalloprotease FtsH [Anaerolineales bacterium]MCB9143029.1 ATP-dependent zinc metalloprotease FtsH [Anaerolineales bacterium]MCO5245035.1 ATP-dependent zinc metalloprotease FtsH [Anaerolineae bacterium]